MLQQTQQLPLLLEHLHHLHLPLLLLMLLLPLHLEAAAAAEVACASAPDLFMQLVHMPTVCFLCSEHL
jgi:hypothetical protein